MAFWTVSLSSGIRSSNLRRVVVSIHCEGRMFTIASLGTTGGRDNAGVIATSWDMTMTRHEKLILCGHTHNKNPSVGRVLAVDRNCRRGRAR